MEDAKIIELYFARDPMATDETDKKYGPYCFAIANNILNDRYDAEECVNDTYFDVWNAIPPARPTRFRAFLATVARRVAFDRYDRKRAAKRGGDSGFLLSLSEEFYETTPADEPLPCERAEFKEQLNVFLASLAAEHRIIFLQRYFYCMSIQDIAQGLGKTKENVKVSLHRTRAKMKEFWQQSERSES